MPVNVENRFLLLYGSQTGQAKSIAEEIAEKAEAVGLHPDIHCLSKTEKEFDLVNERCVVFVVSTTGDGDWPDTASKFMRRIRRKTVPDDYFSSLNFTVLGLGDTNYSNFCNCGKVLHKRLLELGGSSFYEPGWADDGTGLEIVVEPWIDNLFCALKKQLKTLSERPTDISQTSADTCSAVPQSIINISTEKETKNNSQIMANMRQSDQKDTSIIIGKKNNNEFTIESSVQMADKGEKVKLGFMSKTDSDASKPESGPCLTHSVAPLSTGDLTLPALPPAYIEVKFLEDQTCDVDSFPLQNDCPFPSARSSVQMIRITSSTILTADDAVKKALRISLDISKSSVKYEPGDSISVVCPNNKKEVDDLIQRLNLSEKANCLMTISLMLNTQKRRAVLPQHIPEIATLHHVLLTCLDIREPPKKALLRVFAEYTSDPEEKRRLQELCSKQGANDYSKYIREESLSIFDILAAFPSCHPPINSIMEHTSRLKPRPYSACSTPSVDGGRLDFVFNVLEIPGGNGRHSDRLGVCTSWLDKITKPIQKKYDNIIDEMDSLNLNEDIQIPVFTRTNQHFHQPADLSCPVIFIGPGTGVAPFLGFLSDREIKRQSAGDGLEYGDTWLFYGCRNKDKDFLFRKEFEHFKSTGTLTKLCVCFSRDETSDNSPKYVQDLMLQEADDLYNLISNEKSLIYVCGDAKNMAKDVSEAFKTILKMKMDISDDEATGYIMKMRIHKRYSEDVWT